VGLPIVGQSASRLDLFNVKRDLDHGADHPEAQARAHDLDAAIMATVLLYNKEVKR
jgi:hypothetical protein